MLLGKIELHYDEYNQIMANLDKILKAEHNKVTNFYDTLRFLFPKLFFLNLLSLINAIIFKKT